MSKIYTAADQLIGHTPLLELTHIEKEQQLSAHILAKLEYFNPAGSVKDRIAKKMIDDAEHQAEKYVPLKEVAARQEISEKYLENILKVLVQNGFLEGLRGKGGGYRLTRSPDQYTVEEILMLTEGSLAPVTCLTPGASPCDRLANCRTYEMWKGLNDLISNYFSHITLADLALPNQAGNDYVI